MRRVVSVGLALAITGLVFAWLLRDGAAQAFVSAVSRADPGLLALAALLAIAIQGMRAWRFAILADGRLSPPSRGMMSIATRLILLNFILPFKLGELGFPVMMRKAFGMPLAQSAGILILCRLMDVTVVLSILLSMAALLLTSDVLGWRGEILAVIGLMMLILPMVIIDLVPGFQRWLRFSPRLHGLAEQLGRGARMILPWTERIAVFFLTCFIWLSHALIAYLTALSIQAGIALAPLAMASAASNLAFALPINGIAGLGPPQAAWATMLHLAGTDWDPAVATALLCHGLLLVTVSLWGVIDYLWEIMAPPQPALEKDKKA